MYMDLCAGCIRCVLPFVGIFPSAWYMHVHQIALKSPLLLSMGTEQYFNKELALNNPHQSVTPVGVLLASGSMTEVHVVHESVQRV